MDARAAIEQAKARGDRAFFERALDETRGVKALLQTLEQLGRLPTDFDPAPLMRLATHPHDEVRMQAVKALARLENPALLPFYRERLAQEPGHARASGTRVGGRATAHARGNPHADGASARP
jgi:HEAT repeat protein